MPPAPAASQANKDRLARLLHTGHELALGAIAEHLEVSPRQARRTVRALQAEGFPICTRRDGRRKLHFLDEADRHVSAEHVPLTEREMLALAVAARAARAVLAPTPLARPLEAAQAKLLGATEVYTFEPETLDQAWHFGQNGVQAVDPVVFETVQRAVAERRSLIVDYTNASGERSSGRRIDPHAVAAVAGSWLVAARGEWADRVVHFALPDLGRAELGEPFEPDPNFDADLHFREAFGAFAGGEVETVRLRVAPGAAASFRRKRYHSTQLVEEGDEDGLTVSFEVPVNPALCAFIRSFGAAVRVLAPDTLAERIAAEATEVAALYGGTAQT